jgi:hypothetical protein
LKHRTAFSFKDYFDIAPDKKEGESGIFNVINLLVQKIFSGTIFNNSSELFPNLTTKFH